MAQTQNLTGTIAAYFDDSADARDAVEALHEAGFISAHMGVAHRGSSNLASTERSTLTGTETADTARQSRNEGKQRSFTTWDKVKNWFSGDEPEPYADEPTRGKDASHEVIDPDAANYGYSSSDLHGSFRGLDIPDEQSRYFSHRLGQSRDGSVVTVNAGVRRAEAEEILSRYGGDIGSSAATYDYGATTAGTTTAATHEGYSDEYPENIQLLGEVLRVHKDRVSRGEVRVRKEVVTDNQTVQVPVTREELVIERRPAADASAPASNISETEIRVPLSEEHPSVDKSTVVREEVSVGKRPVEEVRDVEGQVRREELVVEDPTKNKDPNRRVA